MTIVKEIPQGALISYSGLEVSHLAVFIESSCNSSEYLTLTGLDLVRKEEYKLH